MNKKIIVTAIAGLLALPGAASAVSIGGIELGTSGFNFQFADIFEERVGGGPITTDGDELAGFGEVSSIRDNNGDLVWARGGIGGTDELTFVFSGFIADVIDSTHIDFSGGSITFYADISPDFNPVAGTGAGAGAGTTEWLNLTGTPQNFGGTHAPDRTLHSTGTLLGATVLSGTGVGLLDVAAGAGVANSNFNTNSFAFTSSTGAGFADFDFNSSFTNTGAGLFATEFNGTANLRGFTPTVPEPASLALMGLGLMGFAAARRKKA